MTKEMGDLMVGCETETKDVLSGSLPRKRHAGMFKPGNPGGPGRPKGCLSPATRFRNRIAEEFSDELLNLAMDAVRGGKAHSLLATMLTFVAGTAKAETAPIELPEAIEGTYEDRTEAISKAMLEGRMSPDAAKVAIEQLKTTEEAKQLREMNEEIRALKAKVITGTARRID